MSKTIAVASLPIAIAFWGIAGMALAGETSQSQPACPSGNVTKVVTFCFKDEKTRELYFEAIKKSAEKESKDATSPAEWNPNSCQGGAMIVVDGKGYCGRPLPRWPEW